MKGAPCLSTPVGSEDPKTAAVVCVRVAPITSTSPLSHNAFHAHQDTIVPQVQTTTRVILALLGMSVRWDPPKRYHAPLALLVTSLMLRKSRTVTHVQLAPSTTCSPRRPAFPVAAPPPHLQVLLLVPVLERTVHSSTQMVHVCAELVLSSMTNWISKALHLTVNWTASLR